MKFEKIKLDEWKRAKLFHTYINDLKIVMSMTAEIDVAPLLSFIRENGLKFYPAMIWIVSKIVNSREEFRLGQQNGEVGRWDYVSPYYAHFHAEDEACAKLVTEYGDDLFDFHARFLADRKRFESLRAFDLTQIPPNTFDVSCLPWIKYKSFDMHVFDSGTYLAPVVTWGKWEREGERAMMPLSMNIHHAAADGFHLSRFFAEVQALIDHISLQKF